MVKDTMVTDQISSGIGRFTARIVLDDRSRLPGRFFGRFATSATWPLTRVGDCLTRLPRDLLKEFQ